MMAATQRESSDRLAQARGLIEQALALLDAEGSYVASAHLGHALDLLEAEAEPVSVPVSR